MEETPAVSEDGDISSVVKSVGSSPVELKPF